MKTIKGSLGYVGFGVSAIISQGQQSLGPQIQKSGRLWRRREGHRDPVKYATLVCAAELSAVCGSSSAGAEGFLLSMAF